ncbi:MAG: adenylosuccinate synthetase [Bacteroidales bacterium]
MRHIRQADELPVELADYIRFIENYLHVPITMVSTGPDREETVKAARLTGK